MAGGGSEDDLISYTWAVEMYLSGAWVDVSADVRQVAPVALSRGIDGTNITDRVAKVGTLSFALDNSTGNSTATLGYYSPDHASVRTGFGLGTLTRLSIVYSATTYYKFYGKISDVTPLAGAYKERYVSVMCVDFMNELLVHNMNKVAVQVNKRGNQLLTTIVANLPTAPLATSYATGPDVFAYALHDIQDEKTSAMNAVQRVDQSGLSYTFVAGDLTGGETLKWQTRHSRLLLTANSVFSNSMTGLTVKRKADSIYNTIKATGYPLTLGTTNEVLWTSRKEMVIEAAATLTLAVRFTDPSGAGKRVAVIPGTEVTPVSDTDYKMSSLPANGGNDLNASLGITVTWGGNTASAALVDNAAVTGYINLFQLRGKIIRLNDPAEVVKTDATSKTAHGDRTLTFALPYLDSINTITAFATELLARLKDPVTAIESLEFVANTNATLMAAAMDSDVGYRTTLTETVTGFSADDFFINSYDLIIEPGKLTCKFGNLEPAGLTANIGIWGTNAGDSGDWGTVAGDSSRWVF